MKAKKISPVVQQALDHYLEQTALLNKASQSTQLVEFRTQAMDSFAQQAFPTQKDEDWQYTRLTSFVKQSFQTRVASPVSTEQVNAFLPSFAVTKVVFVDGWFSEELSDDLSQLPKTASFETFRDVVETRGDIEHLFAIEEEVNKEPFALLNAGLVTDGFYLQLEANSHLDMPLYILHIQTSDMQSTNVRNRVEVGENAEMTLVERYVSLSDNNTDVAFTNVVTHIEVARSARMKQVIMQEQSDKAFYFNNQYVFQAEKSNFTTFFGSAGSQISRHQNHLWMDGEHIETEQNSACLAKESQTVDSRTDTKHNDLHGHSEQLHKFVLTDSAVGVFNGMIRVDQKAQKTDGQMDNANLILSDSARMDSKPQLEIYADDVLCSHGSATGQIDENQVFYLRARGINRADAMKMITHAFLLEPLELISNDAIRSWVNERLSKGLEAIQH